MQLGRWEYLLPRGAVGSPGGLVVKNPPAKVGGFRDTRELGLIRKIPWRRHGNPVLCSCLESPMDRGACQAAVHRITKSWTRLKQLSTHTGERETAVHKVRLWKRMECSVSVQRMEYRGTEVRDSASHHKGICP